MGSQADKRFIHSLFVQYYANREERVTLEVCIRCGSKGKLGIRKPYEGLCKKCRQKEFNER